MFTLYDYCTNDPIRPATLREALDSFATSQKDGGAGVITIGNRKCFVLGELPEHIHVADSTHVYVDAAHFEDHDDCLAAAIEYVDTKFAELSSMWVSVVNAEWGDEDGECDIYDKSRETIRVEVTQVRADTESHLAECETCVNESRLATIEAGSSGMDANQLLDTLVWYELDNKSPSVGRRAVRDERMKLQSALSMRDSKGDKRAVINRQMAEANRVLKMWLDFAEGL
jgi:hypothetical protein